MGNGDGEMISSGLSIEDWLPSPVVAISGGPLSSSNFDSCGSWLMRAITGDSGNVLGFYHAETACLYANNGQTRKSAGYSVSTNGGKTFSKPNYPNNKILDSSSPILVGLPSGEGDISMVLKGNYYYMFFQNVEDYHFGVARAARAGEAYPGSFYKYLNGNWNQPAVGGNSSRLNNIAGTQVYLHTPSQSFVSVGNSNPYWNNGFMMSVSDDAINWQYFADPIFTADPITNLDDIMYPSFLGTVGGYDIGSKFQFMYMWIAPWSDWNHRYQIAKDITLTYVGSNNTMPLTKVALTSYRATDSQETWQSTELCLAPYKPIGIVGYLMTRPYAYSFVVYDCFNYTTNDHFVGTADECFLSGSGVEVIRTLGYMWSIRVAKSIAVYRCYAGQDIFLSPNSNCDGLAPAETVPFGFVMDGPAFVLSQDVLIPQGASWKFSSSQPASTWNQMTFDDSAWPISLSPFGNGYATSSSFFGTSTYYFRYSFTIPAGKTVTRLLMSVSSDDFSTAFLNGVQVDVDPLTGHEASYWNRRVYISTASLIIGGTNVLAVKTTNYDTWAYFDLMLVATYDTGSQKRSIVEELEVEATQEQELPKISRSVAEEELPKITRDIPVYDKSRETRDASSSSGYTTLLAQGSNWKYYKTGVPASTWTQLSFDDSAWPTSAAPFVTGYAAYAGKGTPFGANDYYFRSHFTIPAGKVVTGLQVNVASDNYAIVYINGYLVDSDPSTWHQAAYWNRQVTVATSVVNAGDNIISVVTKNMDQWAFFDLQIQVQYAVSTALPPILIPQGSMWLYYNKGVPATSWIQQNFDDSSWASAPAPFVTGYSAYVGKTPFGPTDYYFRSKFTIPSGTIATNMTVSVASDNYALVYINGFLVDSDPSPWHQATYWNRQVAVDTKILVAGTNTIAVVTKNMDQWAFFDLQLLATYGGGSAPVTPAPVGSGTTGNSGTSGSGNGNGSGSGNVACGIKGQIIGGVCTCDAGWGGSDCNTHLCSYSGTTTENVIPAGSSFRSIGWATVSSTPAGWFGTTFDDSWWQLQSAPFGTSQYSGVSTSISPTRRLFRKKFLVDIPFGTVVQNATLSIASEDVHRIWLNGKFVDTAIYPYYPHTATHWNTVLTIPGTLFTSDVNVLAVEVPLVDGRWTSYFDMQLVTAYSVRTCTTLI
eukprot:Phypoly_transcript_01024.p1 GENE.Phypoly_transcript_01024~~Phypoly_transcript_01024.p1  ORF type:complete len:1186 (+),score=199.02 Phypoly_transcript_01024:87-3560(+)